MAKKKAELLKQAINLLESTNKNKIDKQIVKAALNQMKITELNQYISQFIEEVPEITDNLDEFDSLLTSPKAEPPKIQQNPIRKCYCSFTTRTNKDCPRHGSKYMKFWP